MRVSGWTRGRRFPGPASSPARPLQSFAVADSSGADVSLGDLLAPGVPLMLLFASPRCGPCKTLLPKVATWQSEHPGRLTVAVASDGAPEEVGAEAEELGLDYVLVDQGGELYSAFEANGTPSAVLIAPDGSIASYLAGGSRGVEALVAGVVDVPGLPLGAPVPELELATLDGERVELAEFRGRE